MRAYCCWPLLLVSVRDRKKRGSGTTASSSVGRDCKSIIRIRSRVSIPAFGGAGSSCCRKRNQKKEQNQGYYHAQRNTFGILKGEDKRMNRRSYHAKLIGLQLEFLANLERNIAGEVGMD